MDARMLLLVPMIGFFAMPVAAMRAANVTEAASACTAILLVCAFYLLWAFSLLQQ